MFVLKKNPYGLNTRMFQLVLDRRSGLYAYGPNTRMVWNININATNINVLRKSSHKK